MAIEFEMLTQEQAEQVDFFVCLREGSASPFTDNVPGTCAHCGHAIFHRPQAPQRPTKICMECANELVGMTGSPRH